VTKKAILKQLKNQTAKVICASILKPMSHHWSGLERLESIGNIHLMPEIKL